MDTHITRTPVVAPEHRRAGASRCCAPAIVLAATLLMLGSIPAHAQYDPGWARNFRIGLLAGFNIEAEFQTAGSFTVDGVPGQYADGYVMADDSGNALGLTTRWGYQRADQFNSETRILTLQRTEGYTIAPSSSSGHEDAPYFGLDLAYGGVIWHRQRIRVGWEFGFGFLPISISDEATFSGTLDQVTHGFEVPTGVILPDAPYNGGSSGIGQPSIVGAPSVVSPATNSSSSISGTRTLDVTLYTFRLGPTFYWDAHPKVGLTLSAGGAMGFVTGDYRFADRSESDATAANRGGFSDSDVVFGGYVSATVTYHAVRNGDFYLGIQYMPMGDADFSGDGRSATLDLSGAVYLSAGINWPF